MNEKHVDPIPEQFSSYEEAADFWDAHDTTDYPDAFRTVDGATEFRQRHYEIEIDADVVNALRSKAQQQDISVSDLASDLLRRQLALTK